MAYPLSSDTAYPDFCPIQRINPNRLIRRIHFPRITAYASGTEAYSKFSVIDFCAKFFLSFFRANPVDIFTYVTETPIESNLSITSNDINIELSKEFLVELRKDLYHRTYNEDVVDHIVKVLKMGDLIYVPGVDSHQLRMKVFPLSLADDAKEWWISEEITTWGELVKKFFCRFYPESYDGEDEMLDE
ncbi:hypothetical protein Tco_0341397 [Tanacetum coccineum]